MYCYWCLWNVVPLNMCQRRPFVCTVPDKPQNQFVYLIPCHISMQSLKLFRHLVYRLTDVFHSFTQLVMLYNGYDGRRLQWLNPECTSSKGLKRDRKPMECVTTETHEIRRRTAGLTLHPVTTTRRHERIAVNRFYERYGSTNICRIICYRHN